jgi:predicted DNA-binding transcriptional regulator AlpA
MEYIFTLKYQLAEEDSDHDEFIDRLGAAGCDDALVGIGHPGRIALEFTREAESADAALMSALADVKRAVPSARLIEAAPDFVGLTDAADVVGVSRQNMRKLMMKYPTSFPAPVHEGSAAVWHLADLLIWLQAKGQYDVDLSTAEVAVAAMRINLAKAASMVTRRIQQEVREFVI